MEIKVMEINVNIINAAKINADFGNSRSFHKAFISYNMVLSVFKTKNC